MGRPARVPRALDRLAVLDSEDEETWKGRDPASCRRKHKSIAQSSRE